MLILSHGLVGQRLQSGSTRKDLARWGYVVVALDRTDAAATVFPDGEVRFYDPERFEMPADVVPSADLVEERMFPVWVADQRFVYDALETWQQRDPLFAGRLDLTRIGSLCHSFGGATALEGCRLDSRCDAAANMDGGLYGGSVDQPAARPLLLMTSADSGTDQKAVRKWTHLIEIESDASNYSELRSG